MRNSTFLFNLAHDITSEYVHNAINQGLVNGVFQPGAKDENFKVDSDDTLVDITRKLLTYVQENFKPVKTIEAWKNEVIKRSSVISYDAYFMLLNIKHWYEVLATYPGLEKEHTSWIIGNPHSNSRTIRIDDGGEFFQDVNKTLAINNREKWWKDHVAKVGDIDNVINEYVAEMNKRNNNMKQKARIAFDRKLTSHVIDIFKDIIILSLGKPAGKGNESALLDGKSGVEIFTIFRDALKNIYNTSLDLNSGIGTKENNNLFNSLRYIALAVIAFYIDNSHNAAIDSEYDTAVNLLNQQDATQVPRLVKINANAFAARVKGSITT